MTGFREREDDIIPVKSYRDGGNANDVGIEDLEPRGHITVFLVMPAHVLPAFLEGTSAEDDLVREGFYTAHGATSSSIFFSGIGLWTAFAAIGVQGKSIDAAIVS